MEIETRVNKLLLDQEPALKAIRAYYQYMDKHGLPPIELCQEFAKYRDAGIFCGSCSPSLIMIPSPACYEKSPDFWPNYFRIEHNVRGIRSIDFPFEGIRGAYYPFQLRDERVHVDLVEMDSSKYFNSLSEEEKLEFAKRFFDALQISRLGRGSHIGLSAESQDRTHVSLYGEAYVGFAGWNAPDYNLQLDWIAAMNIPYYRLYQRSCQ